MAAFNLYQEDPYGVRVGVSPYLVQRKGFYSSEKWRDLISKLKCATTVYVGNLSFYTTEEQIYELFSRCGPVKRVIMGLNSKQRTPCGFCFVEYYRHTDAEDAQKYLSGSKLDERLIRADVDAGFEEGRQYGRSKLTGGQVRDEHRTQYDPGRGGWAKPNSKNTNTSTAHPLPTLSNHNHKESHKDNDNDNDYNLKQDDNNKDKDWKGTSLPSKDQLKLSTVHKSSRDLLQMPDVQLHTTFQSPDSVRSTQPSTHSTAGSDDSS